MNVRWTGELDRSLIAMFHADASDAEMAAHVPNATIHAIELRRSFLGLQRAMGPTRCRPGCGPGLDEFHRRLDAAAAEIGIPSAELFRQVTEGDRRAVDRARLATAARGVRKPQF